jgi:hypothetical protein
MWKLSVARMEDGFAEASNLCVVRYVTGCDQWYEWGKLMTWLNGISGQQICTQKYNKTRNKIKERVTHISRNITSDNASKGTAKHFPAVTSTGFWDYITKHKRCFLKRGEEFYYLHSYAASCLAKLSCNQTSHSDVRLLITAPYFPHSVVPSYPRVMHSITYRGYVNLRIITNAIYNVFLVYHRIDAVHLGLKEGPFYPMFCTKLKEPCSFIKILHGPYI